MKTKSKLVDKFFNKQIVDYWIDHYRWFYDDYYYYGGDYKDCEDTCDCPSCCDIYYYSEWVDSPIRLREEKIRSLFDINLKSLEYNAKIVSF